MNDHQHQHQQYHHRNNNNNNNGHHRVVGHHRHHHPRLLLLFVSFVVLSTILHLMIHNSALNNNNNNNDLRDDNIHVDDDDSAVVIIGKKKNDNGNNDDVHKVNNVDDDYENNNIGQQQNQKLPPLNIEMKNPTTIIPHDTNNSKNNNITTYISPPQSEADDSRQQQRQQQQNADTTTSTIWLNQLRHIWKNFTSSSSSLLELPVSFKVPKGTIRICSTWNISIDDWWVHHYRWKIIKETPTEYCLQLWIPPKSIVEEKGSNNNPRKLVHKNRMKMYRQLYENQFVNANCSKTISKHMWSTGWGADFLNIIDGLGYGLTHNVPFAVNYKKTKQWHYSRSNVHDDDNNNKCGEKKNSGSLECYFLNYSKCNSTKVVPKTMLDSKKQFLLNNKYLQLHLWEANNRYIYEWVTRQRTWLRRMVVEFVEPYKSKLPWKECSVIHVRRGDVVLHHNISRRYFEIKEYMTALEQQSELNSTLQSSNNNNNNNTNSSTILLLTDDANAIREAKTLYPNYTWITIDRQRYQGSEGGFEGHFPSNDALKETIVLLGTFQLVQRCTTLIHTHSNLAFLFWGYMLSEHGNKQVTKIEIDSTLISKFDRKFATTVNISRSDFFFKKRIETSFTR